MKYNRRRYLIRTGFQWRFVLGFIAVALMGNLAATLAFNSLAINRLEELRWSVFMSDKSTGEALLHLFLYVNLSNVLFVSALLVITGAWMLRKMNGPIYRITEGLRLIKDGDFSSHIILRQKDEFRDVAEALNEMADRTRDRFSRFQAEYEGVSQALAGLETVQGRESPAKESGNRVISMIKQLKKIFPEEHS